MTTATAPVVTPERSLRDVRAARDVEFGKRRVIGASLAGAILGYDRFHTPLQIWLYLTGRRDRWVSDAVKEAGEWGKIHEPTLLREYAIRNDIPVLGLSEWYQTCLYLPSGTIVGPASPRFEEWVGGYIDLLEVEHPYLRWLVCHPDGIAFSAPGVPDRIIQIKTASAYMEDEWGPEGTDEIPTSYLIQSATEQAIIKEAYGLDLPTDVFALLGGNRGRQHRVNAVANLQAGVIQKLTAFYRNHVEKDLPPDPSDEKDREAFLKAYYPQASGEEIKADEGLEEKAKRLRALHLEKVQVEDEEKRLKNDLMERMGTAYRLVGSCWTATFSEVRGSTSYKSVAEELAGGTIPADLIEKHRGRSDRRLFPKLDKIEV